MAGVIGVTRVIGVSRVGIVVRMLVIFRAGLASGIFMRACVFLGPHRVQILSWRAFLTNLKLRLGDM